MSWQLLVLAKELAKRCLAWKEFDCPHPVRTWWCMSLHGGKKGSQVEVQST